MKYLIPLVLFWLSLPTTAQTVTDSAVHYEYLTIVVESAGSRCEIYIAKDSLTCEKKKFTNDESYNLTKIAGILTRYGKEGWKVLNSNFSVAGNAPFHTYFYYLLYRKKH